MQTLGLGFTWEQLSPGQRFRTLNVEPDGGTPAETAAFIKDEVRRWGEVIRANNIMAE